MLALSPTYQSLKVFSAPLDDTQRSSFDFRILLPVPYFHCLKLCVLRGKYFSLGTGRKYISVIHQGEFCSWIVNKKQKHIKDITYHCAKMELKTTVYSSKALPFAVYSKNTLSPLQEAFSRLLWRFHDSWVALLLIQSPKVFHTKTPAQWQACKPTKTIQLQSVHSTSFHFLLFRKMQKWILPAHHCSCQPHHSCTSAICREKYQSRMPQIRFKGGVSFSIKDSVSVICRNKLYIHLKGQTTCSSEACVLSNTPREVREAKGSPIIPATLSEHWLLFLKDCRTVKTKSSQPWFVEKHTEQVLPIHTEAKPWISHFFTEALCANQPEQQQLVGRCTWWQCPTTDAASLWQLLHACWAAGFFPSLMGNTTKRVYIEQQHWLLELSNKGCTCGRLISLTAV